MNQFKKIFMMITVFSLLYSGFMMQSKAFASGVPQFSYSVNGPAVMTYSPSESYQVYSQPIVLTQIDVGAPYQFSGSGTVIITQQYQAGLFEVDVQGSNDGVNWTTIATTRTNAIDFSYNCGGGMYYHLREVGIYSNCFSYDWVQVQFTNQQVYAVVADQSTAQTAANNASAAQTAAQAAQIAATNAQNGTNTIINSYLSTTAGVVQDSSGNTALSMAKQASQNALFL